MGMVTTAALGFCQAPIRRFFIHSASDYTDSTSWSRQWVYEALWFPFHCGRYDQHRSCCWGCFWWSFFKMACLFESKPSDDSMSRQPYPMTCVQNTTWKSWKPPPILIPPPSVIYRLIKFSALQSFRYVRRIRQDPTMDHLIPSIIAILRNHN